MDIFNDSKFILMNVIVHLKINCGRKLQTISLIEYRHKRMSYDDMSVQFFAMFRENLAQGQYLSTLHPQSYNKER